MSDSFVTLWTVATEASLSMRLSRQEYWSGLPFPPPGGVSDSGMEPKSPALAGGIFTRATRDAHAESLRLGPVWWQWHRIPQGGRAQLPAQKSLNGPNKLSFLKTKLLLLAFSSIRPQTLTSALSSVPLQFPFSQQTCPLHRHSRWACACSGPSPSSLKGRALFRAPEHTSREAPLKPHVKNQITSLYLRELNRPYYLCIFPSRMALAVYKATFMRKEWQAER